MLHHLLSRIAAICRVVSGEGLREFKKASKAPNTTEAIQLAVQRVGQDIFRVSLMDYWASRCAVTGFEVPELLRASHIKPWSKCGTDAERLDVFNGLLLAPHLDVLFDGGWISFFTFGSHSVVKGPRCPAGGFIGCIWNGAVKVFIGNAFQVFGMVPKTLPSAVNQRNRSGSIERGNRQNLV